MTLWSPGRVKAYKVALQREAPATLAFVPGGKGIGGLIDGFKADGGPVSAGESYLVGERGPEVLTMGHHGGVVTPNHQLSEVGGDTHVYVTIDGEQLQGRITRTVRDRDRGVKRALGAGGPRTAPA